MSMTYHNFQDMPEDLRVRVNEALDVLFAKRLPGQTWRPLAEAINEQFPEIDLEAEFVRDVFRRRSRRHKSPDEQIIYDADTPVVRDFESENQMLRVSNQRLFSQLTSAKDRLEDLVRATIDGARDAALSLGPIGPTKLQYTEKRFKDSEAALWHLTDWQGGKQTTSYNSEVMVERVMNFCKKAKLITEIQRADHPVKDCVICFGGDMVEGLFNFPTQPFEIDGTIFRQYVRVSRLIVQVVQYALAMYDHVTVVAEWGNHGRMGSKLAAVPRADNIDRMCYELARQLLENEPRLSWEDCPEDIQRVEVGAYRALLIHCDEVGRNGYASPMTIVNHINRWRSGSYDWDFRDVYGGHYHTHYELALANGSGAFFGTGSTESDNRYARDMMAASARPSQRLHFIDKERGRVSAQYKVYVETE